MKLYKGRIPEIAEEIVGTLSSESDIEVAEKEIAEVRLDIEAVLNEYTRTDRELTEKAKDLLAIRKLDYSYLHKLKSALAEERGFGINEDAIPYVIKQLLEVFMHSVHVEEVYSDDSVIRKKLTQILRSYLGEDSVVDQEVRRRMKNLQEGTMTWEIEYQRVMEEIKRNRKL